MAAKASSVKVWAVVSARRIKARDDEQQDCQRKGDAIGSANEQWGKFLVILHRCLALKKADHIIGNVQWPLRIQHQHLPTPIILVRKAPAIRHATLATSLPTAHPTPCRLHRVRSHAKDKDTVGINHSAKRGAAHQRVDRHGDALRSAQSTGQKPKDCGRTAHVCRPHHADHGCPRAHSRPDSAARACRKIGV